MLDVGPLALPELWQFVAARNRAPQAGAYSAVAAEIATGSLHGARIGHRIVAIGAVSRLEPDGPGLAWLSVAEGDHRPGPREVAALARAVRRGLAREAETAALTKLLAAERESRAQDPKGAQQFVGKLHRFSAG